MVFKEREVARLRTERAMMRATNELIAMLGVTKLTERMVRAAAVRRYGHVLQKEEGDLLQ